MGSRGGSSKTRVSDYYLAAHVGVCHGPVDAVLEVVVGEKLAWQGSSSPADGSQVDGHDVWVDNPGLFGGNKKEGGVRGTMTVMHGAPAQLVPSKIAQFLGLARDKVPGYRGILSLLFHSADGRSGFLWSSNNPYLKALWVKVRARPGTWYPEKAMIDGDANPMHIIRECLVNTDWGMGAASKFFDDAQMRQIADVLYAERFGLSLMWAQQTEIEKFIGEILRHINGTMCVNPRTGKFHFKLIREDYTQDTLPTFNRNQGTIRSSQRKAWDETVNEINVSWTNPASEETEVVTVHDPANITIQGAIVPDSRDMYGIRNLDLATRVAMREIQVASKPLLQVEVDFDRSAFGLLPGDAIKLVDWKELNFAEVVMRVVDIDYGTPDSMVIKASLVEDVFGQPAVYTAEDPNRWQSSAEDPVPMVTWEVMTAPYFMVARLLGETRAQSMTYPAVYPVVLAAPEGKDTNTYVQQAQRGSIAGTGPVWQNSYDRVPVGHAALVDALPIGAVGSATITGLKGRVYAEVGNYLYIGGQNGEICLITDTSTGALTLRRGCLDTSPRAWPAGTPVWLLDDNRHGFDEELSAYGATQNYRLLPTTSKGQLPANLAPVISGTMSDRPFRPYPPANVRVNGDLFPSAKQLPLTITWSERNRILETSVVLPWDGASVPAEPGTSYTLEVDAFAGGAWRANAVAVRDAVVTSFDVKANILPSNTTAIRFRLWAEKDGLRSWTNVEHTFAIGDSGTGLPPGSGVEFGPPPKPVSVTVTAGRNRIRLDPQFASVDKFACEYWRSRVPLKEAEIETEAFKAGQGMFIEDAGLAIDTAYFYFIRAVNDYGKSGWYSMEARTKIDPQEILDEMDGLIDSSKLTPELQEDLEKLPALEQEIGKIPTLEQEINKIPTLEQEINKIPALEQGINKIPALEQSIDRIDTDAEHAALGVISVAIAQTQSEERRLASEASIKDSQVVLADEQQALASRLEVFSTKFETDLSEANAAIRNEATARSDADAAQAQKITDIDTKFTTGLSETNANLTSSVKALTDADKAIIEKVDNLETSFEGDLSSVNAAIQQEATTRADADAAQAQLINNLDTKFTGGISQANAAIQQEATTRSDADKAQAQLISGLDTKFTTGLSETNANLTSSVKALTDADKAIIEKVDNLETSFEGDLSSVNAAIQQEATTRADADAAQAQLINQIDAKFTSELADTNAAITEEAIARAEADSAQASVSSGLKAEIDLSGEASLSNALKDFEGEQRQLKASAEIRSELDVVVDDQKALASRVDVVETSFETEIGKANAAIRQEATARSDADAAQAQLTNSLDTKFTTGLTETNANLESSVKALTDADKAIIEKVDSLETSFNSDLSDVNAAVQQEVIARSDADAAQAQLINSLDAKFSTGLSDANAAITEEAAARAEADSAQASMSTGLKAEIDHSGEASLSNALKDFEGEQRQLKASADIRTEMNVVVDSQKALAERVDVVESSFETEIGKTNAAITDLARSTTTADRALAESVSSVRAEMVKADNALSAEIRRVDTASTTADKALAESVSSVRAELNGTVATVQQHSQSIVGLEGGAQAMWSIKAQAGDITAGIGLTADQATGKSQVMVNASQFFVFDNAVGKTAIFAIDQGQVIIRDAVIRKATINILNATEITAKNVKAGQAGFGDGGSYPMFGQNWHTTISSDGSVKTDRLYAAGGYVRNMTIGNCVIEQDCVVKGTVFADRIVGDVYVARDYSCVTHEKQVGPIDVCSIKVNQAVGFARTLTIPGLAGLVGCSVTASGGGSAPISNSNTTTMQVTVLMDGVVVKTLTATASAYATSNPSSGPVTNVSEVGTIIGDITIPANREPSITIRIQRIRGDGWVRSDPSQSGRVVLFKQGSSLS